VTSVLVVDDNHRNRKLAVDVLSASGLRTFGAETAAQGIALAREHVPDVILMDLRLPDMDGVEATRKLAAHERTALIPVVAMSASPLEGTEDWLGEAGFAGWLEKPIHVSTFPEQVRRYCAQKTEG
jgi:two-component system cell cycle response regulator DivK